VQYIAYLYYSAIKHFEQAQMYLQRYITVSGDAKLLDTL